ncbi:ATP12-domain-containing protein [Athelia psychrophila]|uniref:ATP12-domain-containing protein n=1 Tax=Athelia psychrophila TaxID=1759441 RepID=A0A166JEN4_9AGAM|nr:ATP12-domain-containing protein [Fibularhizoctonia sp. CBS 109695]
MLALRLTRSRLPWAARHLTTATDAAPSPVPEAVRRFWKTVGVDQRADGVAVKLDHRTLRTPAGNPMLLPKSKTMLATVIAHEWDFQERLVKHHALPMTSLASRAIDDLGNEATRDTARAALLEYLDTDTIWLAPPADIPHFPRSTAPQPSPVPADPNPLPFSFFQDEPPPLVVLQDKLWEPLLDWARDTYGVEINKFGSLLYNSQPAATKAKFDSVLKEFDQWEMAAMERATYTTKSFIVALALVTRHLTAEQAAATASVELDSQIERWGSVEDTHDVDYQDSRRQLGSAACLLSNI